MPRIAVYTGVFDPVHFGHLDIIERGSKLFDRLIVAVGDNPDKTSLFTQDERVAMIRETITGLPNVEAQPFHNLAVKFVRELGARVMLRGIRTTSDMEYEFMMSLTNLALDATIETVFLMARENHSHVSGTLLRQIARLGGELQSFVPPSVKAKLIERATQK